MNNEEIAQKALGTIPQWRITAKLYRSDRSERSFSIINAMCTGCPPGIIPALTEEEAVQKFKQILKRVMPSWTIKQLYVSKERN